jgi:NAD(P)H-dependent FMN reductase
MTHLAALDGSLRPGSGNTARAIDLTCAALPRAVTVDRVALATYRGTVLEMAARLRAADGLLVATGTYWGSWGSPLQQLLELMTAHEATDVFLGKPASVVVTMDSTGGTEVAARLAATLVCLGCWTPPLGWMALSRVGTELAAVAPDRTGDVWTSGDLTVLAANLATAAAAPRAAWRAWSVERAEPVDHPWPTMAPLPGVAPDFLRDG